MIKHLLGRSATFLVALLMVGAVAQNASAQQLKVGYTDHEIIIVNMPEYQTLQQRLQQEYQSGQQELQQLYQGYQEKLDRYQKQQALLSEETRQQREQELMQMQQDLQQQAQAKDQELGQREAELMKPLLERVQNAIDTVAEQQELDLVLRAQVGTQPLLLYVNQDRIVDITMDVARNLGLEVDPEAAPAAQGPAGGN